MDGQVVALKPANLEVATGAAAVPPPPRGGHTTVDTIIDTIIDTNTSIIAIITITIIIMIRMMNIITNITITSIVIRRHKHRREWRCCERILLSSTWCSCC